MIVAVFDTNVILQGILNEGGPADECLRAVFNGKIRLIVTGAILNEVLDVISRPALVAKYPILKSNRPKELIEKIQGVAAIVEQPLPTVTLERDRTDEIFLNLALAYDANDLVSRDRDLLDLNLDEAFAARFPRLRIVTPVDFLETIRSL